MWLKLPTEDEAKVDSYIKTYGLRRGCLTCEEQLAAWSENKRHLYHLLGGKFIHTFEVEWDNIDEIAYKMADLVVDQNLEGTLLVRLRNIRDTADEEIDISTIEHVCDKIFSLNNFLNNKISNIGGSIKLINPITGKKLCVQDGAKPFKILLNLIKFLGLKDDEYLMEQYEEFRLEHSRILTTKGIHKDAICISIHPLDFLTMSDNNMGWTSCFSWREAGRYRVAALEAMNSNNLVCAYISGKNPYMWIDRESGAPLGWNNKKWRSLFVVTNDILISGKNYPFQQKSLNAAVLNELKRLSEEYLNRTYIYGIEKYQDMKRVDSLYRMNKQKRWVRTEPTVRRNIILDSKGLYNDFLENKDVDYWCYRNPIKRRKVVSISGPCKCLRCNGELLEEKIGTNEYTEDAYSNKYLDTRSIICFDCKRELRCSKCKDNYYEGSDTININGNPFCINCAQEYLKLCPCCGEPFDIDDPFSQFYMTKIPLDSILWENILFQSTRLYACENCQNKMIEDGIIVERQVFKQRGRSDLLIADSPIRYLTDDNGKRDILRVREYLPQNLSAFDFK